MVHLAQMGSEEKTRIMISIRSVIKFLIIFFITYSVLLIPQTGIKPAFAGLICYQGNAVFKNIEKDRVVTLQRQKEDVHNDIVLVIKFIFRPSGEIRESWYAIDTGVTGYNALIFFLALVAATPLGWKRKIFAFVLGFALMNIFILLQIRVIILCALILSTGTGINYDAATKANITFWYDYFVVPIALGYFLALILWIIFSLGKNEWQKLNGVFDEVG